MKKDEIFSKLTGSSIPTYYNWKREERLLINFIEKYQDDIEEFLETGKCSKLENSNSEQSILNDENIKDMLVGIIIKKKKTEINHFEKEIMMMFRAFEPYEYQINKETTKNELIEIVKEYKFKIIRDKIVITMNENTRTNSINFLKELSNFQVEYIVNNFKEFLTILWEARNYANQWIDFDRKPEQEV